MGGGMGGPPMGGPTAPPMGGPSKSTAPTASAAPVVEDLPVCWPLPTKTQQKLSTTQATAAANREIQARSAGGGMALGDTMSEQDLSHVRGVFTMLLDASSQDGNQK